MGVSQGSKVDSFAQQGCRVARDCSGADCGQACWVVRVFMGIRVLKKVSFRRRLGVPISMALSVLSSASFAEHVTDMEAVNVVGRPKTVQRLDDIPVKTEILTAHELRKVHATDLADALRYVPGLQLKKIHGKTGVGIWMQGYDADRVLVLIDGSPVSPSTGSTVDITQIAIGDVERIEIIRGSVSALYGTSAMGGVVNIITRKPTDALELHSEVTGGSWGRQNLGDDEIARQTARVNLSGVGERAYWQLVADARFSDGFRAVEDREATQGWEGHKANLSGKFSFQVTDATRITLMPRFYDEDASTLLDNFVPGVGNLPVDKRDLTERQHLAVELKHQASRDARLKLRVMYEDFISEAAQDVIATTGVVDRSRDTQQVLSEAELRMERVLTSRHAVTVGLMLERGEMDVVLRTDETQAVKEVDHETSRSTQVFFQDSWLITEGLEVMPGVRFHASEGFGSHTSPMLSALWSRYDWLPGEVSLRAGVGNGYRVPNLREQHYIFDHSHLGYMVIGNPDLEPESSISYQLGLEWLAPNDAMVEAHVFRNDTRDLIETLLDPEASAETGLSIYNYQNFDRTRSDGFESVFRKRWHPSLSTSLSYTYLHAKDRKTGKYLVRRPRHDLKAGVDWRFVPSTELVVRVNHQSKEYVDAENVITSPAFTTLDIKFNHDLSADWQLIGGVNNVTDVQRDFQGQDFRPIEGRYVYAGIRFQWMQPRNTRAAQLSQE
ncbi:MAG TPA: hypothetical protein DD979_11330 [Gammaproteobacteria bacterium]|nr:hypothetical protein [Gammaproteobacteria bacterium]